MNSTSPNFNTSDLHLFDQQYGLPDPPSFTKVNQNGQASPLPAAAPLGDWGIEISLDVEWAHAMAPGANIVLVEASSDLFTAAASAAKLATVVSMSFHSGDPSSDSTFNVPSVAFLAASGDSGVPGDYPAFSPNVVAVGGTALQNLDSNGDYPGTGTNGEVGWSGGGGGVSQNEPEPTYQEAVQQSGFREIPDIAADAAPYTPVGGLRLLRLRHLDTLGYRGRHQPFLAVDGRDGRHRRPGPGHRRRHDAQLQPALD